MKPDISPQELRNLIRSRQWTTPTSGSASGYLQANLVMLPAEEAFNFLLFCVRNPKPCPILDVLEPGQTEPIIASGADLRTDLPRYKIFENGEFKTDLEDVSDYFDANMVSFLLGCSFSFENAMVAAGLPIRNMEEGKNVSMYITNKPCLPAGPFSAQLVVTMRPMTPEQAVRAVQVTTRFHLTHGAPIHLGDPQEIGIRNLDRPGVTSQLAATSAPLPRVITHAPGHMFVSDLKDEDLTIL
jgi:uncharacterized protein YcsI (UPF0317 family)